MRFAYMISAHDKPAQLQALLERLLPPGTPDVAVVHIDCRSALWRARGPGITNGWPADAEVIANPTHPEWGGPGQLRATTLLLSAAIAKDVDFVHYISGADWPVVSRSAIVADIAGHAPGTAFHTTLGAVQVERMQGFWPNTRELTARIADNACREAVAYRLQKASRIANRMLAKLPVCRSQPLGSWQKGWGWWALPRPLAIGLRDMLVGMLGSRRLTLTTCSDEHVVATWLARASAPPQAGYRRYIDWIDGAPSPRVLTRDDIPAIIASDAWFARKFDAAVDDSFLTAFPEF